MENGKYIGKFKDYETFAEKHGWKEGNKIMFAIDYMDIHNIEIEGDKCYQYHKPSVLDEIKVRINGNWYVVGDYNTLEEFNKAVGCKDGYLPDIEDWEVPEIFEDLMHKEGISRKLFLIKRQDEMEGRIILAYAGIYGAIEESMIDSALEDFIGEFESLYDLGYYLVHELNLITVEGEHYGCFDYEGYANTLLTFALQIESNGNYYFWYNNYY